MSSIQNAAGTLLVLTATITPPSNVPNLKRLDPRLRRQDYREGLAHYLALPETAVNRVVFLENSGSDVSDLEELAANNAGGKQVEIISFQGLDYPSPYGRAYGEFKMLDTGFQLSRLMQALKPQDVFWKVTGRLRVLNLVHLMRTAPAGYQLMADFRHWPQKAVDLRLMTFTRDGYERLLAGRYPILREDALKSSCEHYLYKEWLPRLEELRIVPRYRIHPRIAGVSGEHDRDYYGGINMMKTWLRVILRRLAPSVWI